MEGVKQAQLLTNSVQVKAGLPDSILQLSQFKMEQQDALVQKYATNNEKKK